MVSYLFDEFLRLGENRQADRLSCTRVLFGWALLGAVWQRKGASMTHTRRDSPDRFIASLTEDGRYRLLVGAVTDYAIYMLDVNGTVTSWNAGAQRFKGYEEAEILGEHFSRFYTMEDREAGLPARALATAAGAGRFEGEGWRVRKDGTHFWASVIIDPIRDPLGNLVGYAKITRDLTERREAQLALEKAREALFQSQKMDALGRLTGGIAHDFNNLLTAVLGSLEIARKRVSGNASATRLIDNAIRGAQRGAALTQRMLAFARHQDLKVESIDIQQLVRGMADLLERSLGPSLRIETRFPPDLQRVTADPHQLEMALLNLAVNARDAMPQGGAIIIAARPETIDTGHPKLAPGSYICVSVTDAGEGMDEDTLARSTEPFFTTKEVGKGTGLGLSMVRGLAEQSGGQLVLNSRKGEGTTAELWLPVATTTPVAANGKASEQALPPSRRSLAVLVVDDDNLVLTNFALMLEDLGHKVFEASSAQEALAILRRGTTTDLVITDQAMPQMTGVELIGKIKVEWPHLPVILATGYGELSRETDPFLPRLAKPFLQDDLAKAVSAAMTKPSRGVMKFRAS
jgi:PAS domain S-box-containing protein